MPAPRRTRRTANGQLASQIVMLKNQIKREERLKMDLAKEMGSGIQRQQDMRKARGSMLFQEYKKKMGMVQSEAAPAAAAASTPAAPPKEEKQKIQV